MLQRCLRYLCSAWKPGPKEGTFAFLALNADLSIHFVGDGFAKWKVLTLYPVQRCRTFQTDGKRGGRFFSEMPIPVSFTYIFYSIVFIFIPHGYVTFRLYI